MMDGKLCLGIAIHFLGINTNGFCVKRNPTSLAVDRVKPAYNAMHSAAFILLHHNSDRSLDLGT